MSIGLSQQMALQRTMDVIANNLANMNTTGYKTESVLFEEFVVDVTNEDGTTDTVSFVIDSGLNQDFTTGPMEITNTSFDIAINGPGFFVVQTDAGDRYTRNGHFSLSADGLLTTKAGEPLLDLGGNTIPLPPEDRQLFIASNGSVATESGPVGQLAVVDFAAPQLLMKEGASLYSTDDIPVPVDDPKIVQGAIEKSNVSPILEMTNMIQIMRAYQTAAQLSQATDEMISKAINQLGNTA